MSTFLIRRLISQRNSITLEMNGQILYARWMILSNVRIDSNFTYFHVWSTSTQFWTPTWPDLFFGWHFFCELGKIMTSYDLLYGTDEWCWTMFTLDRSKFELDRSSFCVDLSHELAIITYYWWIIFPVAVWVVFCRFQNTEHLHEFYKQICVNGMNGSWTDLF